MCRRSSSHARAKKDALPLRCPFPGVLCGLHQSDLSGSTAAVVTLRDARDASGKLFSWEGSRGETLSALMGWPSQSGHTIASTVSHNLIVSYCINCVKCVDCDKWLVRWHWAHCPDIMRAKRERLSLLRG